MTSYDEIAELATQPADQQSAEDQPAGIGTADTFTPAGRSRSRASAGDGQAMILRVKGWLTRLRVWCARMKNFSPAMMITPKRCLPAPLKRLRDMMIW